MTAVWDDILIAVAITVIPILASTCPCEKHHLIMQDRYGSLPLHCLVFPAFPFHHPSPWPLTLRPHCFLPTFAFLDLFLGNACTSLKTRLLFILGRLVSTCRSPIAPNPLGCKDLFMLCDHLFPSLSFPLDHEFLEHRNHDFYLCATRFGSLVWIQLRSDC